MSPFFVRGTAYFLFSHIRIEKMQRDTSILSREQNPAC